MIHYHVDCTDIWHLITKEQIETNAEWILAELDTWNPEYITKGRGISAGSKGIYTGGWLRFNELQTMEFRVGEMTFDYPILVKRIIHCNEIVRKFKISLLEGASRLELELLQNKLKEMKKEEVEDSYRDLATVVVQSRTKKI